MFFYKKFLYLAKSTIYKKNLIIKGLRKTIEPMPFEIKNFIYKNLELEEGLQFALKELDYFLIPVCLINQKQNDIKEVFKSEILDLLQKKYSVYDYFLKENFFGEKDSIFLLPNLKESTLIFFGLGKLDKEKNLELYLSKTLINSLNLISKKDIKNIGIDIQSFYEFYKYYEKNLNLKSLITNLMISFSDYTYHSLEAKEINKQIENLYILSKEKIQDNLIQFCNAVLNARSSTMDLVNMPANKKTTNTLVEKAKSLEKLGLKVLIQDDLEWIKKNMPCFYIVSKGSIQSDPPKWISVEYKPSTEIKLKIALIGKSIIFDTGGYQVKPDNYMNTMKADMTGGATVLSIIEEIQKIQLPYIQITGYLAVTPNKIDSDAMLPDSIVESASGKKVEIRHTDAEGRLTLIDALALAEKEDNDIFIIVATLTGSAARAVGPRIALMATVKQYREEFEKSCEEICEPYQSLEVDEEDFEDIKSKLDGADINNTGSEKYRGAQTAAAFVFSGLSSLKKPVLHLDIAGGDMTKEEKATGITVKGILNYLWNLAQKINA